MKRVNTLSDSDRTALDVVYRQGSTHRERQRAQSILLSSRGYNLEQLSDILAADRDTISRWLARWEAEGLGGLSDAPRSGRPHKMDAVADAAVREILENPSPNLKSALLTDLQKKGSR